MTAAEVLQNPKFLDCDLELIKNGDIYRGPIKSIYQEDGKIKFELKWCAKSLGEPKRWRKCIPFPCSADISTFRAHNSGNKLISFFTSLGPVTLLCGNNSSLDPSKVEGLNFGEDTT